MWNEISEETGVQYPKLFFNNLNNGQLEAEEAEFLRQGENDKDLRSAEDVTRVKEVFGEEKAALFLLDYRTERRSICDQLSETINLKDIKERILRELLKKKEDEVAEE